MRAERGRAPEPVKMMETQKPGKGARNQGAAVMQGPEGVHRFGKDKQARSMYSIRAAEPRR